MSIQVINPAGVSLQQWCDFMVPELEQFGNLGKIHGDNWQEWGAQLLNLPALSGSIVPSPYLYDDWRAWARRANENFAEVP